MPTSPAPALPARSRTPGLDTLRALAIVLVFAYHYRVFVDAQAPLGWAGDIGWMGVDLFFVLSGYLIANQLFAGLARGGTLSLVRFYGRRALRTLPVFWLVLAVYFAWPDVLGGKAPPPLWRFLTFTQNIDLPPGTAFSHAWSLCIEEQFYLALPLVLVAGLRWHATRTQGWLLMGALLALGIAARTVLWQRYGLESSGKIERYYPLVYYATLCRFDEFLPGVAVAMLQNFHPLAWARLMRHGQATLALGIAAAAVMGGLVLRWYYIDGVGYGFFMSAFGYSLIAMAFAVLVVAALSPGSWLHRWRVPGALPLALWSYSIYLSHKAVAHLLQDRLAPLGWPAGLLLAVIAIASVGMGALLYRAVEAPFTALRPRFFPSNFTDVRPPAPALPPLAPRSAAANTETSSP